MPRWAWLLIAGVLLVAIGTVGVNETSSTGRATIWFGVVVYVGIAVGFVGLIGAGIAAARPRRRD